MTGSLTPENEKLLKYGTAKKMFAKYKELSSNCDAPKPFFDSETGRYTNESIQAWMDHYADGLIYGVQVPLYSFSTGTDAVKTDANEGLVLEPSTNDVAGRNDYVDKKLFWCTRVNGGVDADGMPYVTAIEGMDDRFSATEANTWALTPVYYAKYTETDKYVWQQYSDMQIEGYVACAGAYTSNNVLRPYILRACYMDSDGNCTSKSGTLPSSGTHASVESWFRHSLGNDFHTSRMRYDDGVTFLTYGDVTYQTEFMQLMLGVKAPKSVAHGCIDYLHQCQTIAESLGHEVRISAVDGAKFRVGSYVGLGTSSQYGSPNHCSIKNAVRVAAVEVLEDDAVLTLESDDDIYTVPGNWLSTSWYRNGSCDDILGTYGCFDMEGLTDDKAPFRFQNIEWQLGLYEVLANTYLDEYSVYIAPDVNACSGINREEGWYNIGNAAADSGYIKDYKTSHGVRFPRAVGATSTTGFMTHYWPNVGLREWAVGGYIESGSAESGVGCVSAWDDINAYTFYYGGRASAIGHSALAE